MVQVVALVLEQSPLDRYFNAPHLRRIFTQELPQVIKEKGDGQSDAISCNGLHIPKVEVKGLEPMTSCLQSKRSPN
jgi:hypothetical protein